jgi:hypothetical protein
VIITTVFLGEQSYRFAPIDFNRWTKKKKTSQAQAHKITFFKKKSA